MRIGKSQVWFLAFTAVFAVLAGVVFWGSWALDMVPIMPDCATSFSDKYIRDAYFAWRESGKFVPGDLTVLLGGPYLWVELRYAFAAYCAALGMAYFLRGRGLCRLAAYGAGLLLAFSGYWLTLFSAGHLGWFQWMTYGVFAFGLIDRAIEKGRIRHWLLLGAVMAWGSFYQPDLWLLFTLFTGVYFIFRLVACVIVARRSSSPVAHSVPCSPFPVPFQWPRFAIGAAASLAVFVAVGLPSFRSAFVNDLSGREKQIEEGQTLSDKSADDPEKRWIFATNWSMPPEDALEFLVPGVHGDTSCKRVLAVGGHFHSGVKEYTGRLGRPIDAKAGNYRQHSLYVGFVTCLLALVGVVGAFLGVRRGTPDAKGASLTSNVSCPVMCRPEVIFFTVAALVFCVFSMGRYCEPVYRIVFKLPFGDMLRAPVKWHHLTEFCIVVLAGFGIDRLCALASKKGTVLVCVVGVVVLGGAIDLATRASLYLAPHDASVEIIPTVELLNQLPPCPLTTPIPENPSEAKRFRDQIREMGKTGFVPFESNDGQRRVFKFGKFAIYNGVNTIKVPLRNGKKHEYKFLVIQRHRDAPAPRKAEDVKPLKGFAFFAAILSVAATLAVAVFTILSVSMPRRARKQS
ncbi:MAG: hypothetical protein IJI54_05450 [Kiritimatiellae bacterium]|nr:hypothetical protein [Kiritimatiellia bacterium]